MRISLIAMPLACFLAATGVFLGWQAAHAARQNLGFNPYEPQHWVTSQMEVETAAVTNRRAPEMKCETEAGKPFQLAPAEGDKPQFVLFIKDNCPCSIDAQPLFNRLAEKFGSQISFVGVIDGDQKQTKEYASQFSVAFPVIADAKLNIIHAYKADAGIFSCLVAKNGHIIKMWPGYSASLLEDMNHVMSAEAGVRETSFDPQYAPIKKATGCAYSW